MSKFKLPCAFLVNVNPINFQEEKHMPFKETDVFNFSCSINVTVTSQSDIPSFLIKQCAYI